MKLAITLTLGCLLSGCAHPILIAGDAAGMRAYMDGTNGLISNARIAADKKSAHWQLREVEEVQRTQRSVRGGLWGKLSSLMSDNATSSAD